MIIIWASLSSSDIVLTRCAACVLASSSRVGVAVGTGVGGVVVGVPANRPHPASKVASTSTPSAASRMTLLLPTWLPRSSRPLPIPSGQVLARCRATTTLHHISTYLNLLYP